MSGFVGGWVRKGVIDKEAVQRATRSMQHRGPDEEKFAWLPPVFFGFRRLKVIDLQKGVQPASNEDGTLHLVCNGEIYNYRELRRELQQRGHRFKSESDSEVILHLYEEDGEDCVHKLRGMFAFCLYDRENGVLFGARDRLGIKPYYYLKNSRFFGIASEAKALLELLKERPPVNRLVVPQYLSFQYIPEPETIFEGIYKVPPGHYFIYREGELSFNRYWEATFNPVKRPLQEYLEMTRDSLREAVRLHTRSDVPWGAFLSGGVDSAIIAALLREQHGSISTFSVGYEEDAYSELSEAREAATHLETDHREYLINPREYWENLPRLIWYFDEPVADPAAISLYFVARMASRKITVTLSGEGADEVFGGYAIYREPGSLRPLTWMPQSALRMLAKGARKLPGSLKGKNYFLRAATPLQERFIGNAHIFSEGEKANLLRQKSFPSPQKITAPLYRKAASYDEVTQMQYLDIHTWMTGDILVKADKMTMANSLELRAPFLDHRVFEMASTIPTEYKIRGKQTKYLLRQAFAHLLPTSTTLRPKKGFPVPTRVWLKGAIYRQVRQLLLDTSLERYFHRQIIDRMLREHQRGVRDHSRKLWVLIVFAFWLERFLNN